MKRLARLATLAAAASLTLAVSAFAETPQEELEALVKERNDIHAELAAADRQAARAVLRDDKPFEDYARQAQLQDRLDLIEIRMEVLASRYGLELPEPVEEQPAVDEPKASREAAVGVLNVGESRTQQELARQTARLLASIDFRGFLENAQ